MTNVKAGDLAIVKSSKPEYNGRIVQVLYAAPSQPFRLPNGVWSDGAGDQPHWVVKAVGGKMPCPMRDGIIAQVWYGVGADRYLRPLPGDLEDISEQIEQPVAAGDSNG